MEKMIDCKEEGYHDWQVIEVNGTLPHQEIVLECSRCGAEVDNITFEVYD